VSNDPLALLPGEKMVLKSHPHWWFFWQYVVAALVVLGLVVLGSMVGGSVGGFLLWVALAAFVVDLVATLARFVVWRTTTFAVSDKRVAYQSGLVSRRGVSIPLNRVNNVNFSQGVVDRMLNNGTVTIESAGQTGDSVFENIPDPQTVRQMIFTQMDADEQADSHRDAAAIADALKEAPGAGASPAAHERLTQLESLRAKGLVTDDEYAAKRAEILGDL